MCLDWVLVVDVFQGQFQGVVVEVGSCVGEWFEGFIGEWRCLYLGVDGDCVGYCCFCDCDGVFIFLFCGVEWKGGSMYWLWDLLFLLYCWIVGEVFFVEFCVVVVWYVFVGGEVVVEFCFGDWFLWEYLFFWYFFICEDYLCCEQWGLLLEVGVYGSEICEVGVFLFVEEVYFVFVGYDGVVDVGIFECFDCGDGVVFGVYLDVVDVVFGEFVVDDVFDFCGIGVGEVVYCFDFCFFEQFFGIGLVVFQYVDVGEDVQCYDFVVFFEVVDQEFGCVDVLCEVVDWVDECDRVVCVDVVVEYDDWFVCFVGVFDGWCYCCGVVG